MSGMINSIKSWLTDAGRTGGQSSLDLLKEDVVEVERALGEVEEVLRRTGSSVVPLASDVIAHLVGAGGKRLRPILLFLCYGAGGGESFDEAKPYAAATELIHTATLLHDDVIDQGETRRGEPAANRRFGNTLSVLGGDFLVARVMDDVLKLPRRKPARHLAATMCSLVEGEFLQREYEGSTELGEEQYLQVARKKTSSLFSYAAWCGSFLPEGHEELANRYARFAEGLGVAFQIADDVLDFESEETGKTPLADVKGGTISLPMIYAIEESPSLGDRLDEFLSRPDDSELDEGSIVDVMRETRALERARERAREFASLALASLESTPDNDYRQALEDICHYISERST